MNNIEQYFIENTQISPSSIEKISESLNATEIVQKDKTIKTWAYLDNDTDFNVAYDLRTGSLFFNFLKAEDELKKMAILAKYRDADENPKKLIKYSNGEIYF